MKKMLVAIVAAALATGALAEDSVRTEAYVNIPGEKAVHVMAAKVTFHDGGIVTVETPWGVAYTTHFSNVVLVTRRNGGLE